MLLPTLIHVQNCTEIKGLDSGKITSLPKRVQLTLPCGSQPAAPKLGSMTKIVFPQVQHADTKRKI